MGVDFAVVDVDTTQQPRLYNDHAQSSRTAGEGNTYTWEIRLSVYGDEYVDGVDTNSPVKLINGKEMGFALAYCDNDASEHRENFIGSVRVDGADKDRGWKDAGIFGKLVLK